MSRLVGAFLLILYAGSVYGIDCSFGSSKNIWEQYTSTCPGILNPDKSYCCYDLSNESVYCCTAEEFAVKTGLGIIIPAIIAVVVVIGLIICCVSCLCCSCCPWYRRRRQGTVYGKVQTPAIVQVIQPQSNLPSGYTSQASQNQYVPYPVRPTEMSQPPSYSNEAYAKQAPYNPTYQPQ